MKIKNNPEYKKLSLLKKIYIHYIIFKTERQFKKGIKKIFSPFNIKNIDVKFDIDIPIK